MLHEALLVAARRAQVEQEKVATADLLAQLPVEVLREIAETGEIKLAYGVCSPDGGDGGGSWVSQFKGTPFFQQAIALEQECLQSEMANQQANSLQNQKSQEQYALMDQVRLKKKLLELQKARNEAQVLDQGAGAPAMAGSPDPTGTAPGGTAGPPMEDLKTVTASLKLALSAQTLGAYAKKQTNPQGLASASKSLLGRGSQLIGGGDAAAGVKKVNQGNLLARKATAVSPAGPPVLETAPMAKAAKAGDNAEEPGFFNKHMWGHSLLNPLPGSGFGAGAASVMAERGDKDGARNGALVGALAGAAAAGIPLALRAAAEGLSGTGVALMIPLAAIGGAVGGAHAGHAYSKPHKKEAAMKTASIQAVEGWARQMAQADAEKIAHAQEALSIGDAAGRMMAKQAGVGEGLMALVQKHPGKALAIAGGVAGATHGLLKEDGGLGEAAKEGITGAALGGAVGHIGGRIHGHMATGREFGDAANTVKDELGTKIRGHYDNMKSTFDAGAKKVTDAVS